MKLHTRLRNKKRECELNARSSPVTVPNNTSEQPAHPNASESPNCATGLLFLPERDSNHPLLDRSCASPSTPYVRHSPSSPLIISRNRNISIVKPRLMTLQNAIFYLKSNHTATGWHATQHNTTHDTHNTTHNSLEHFTLELRGN